MARCPDCCKFVSLDSEDPEEENFDFTIQWPDGVEITASIIHRRNCAECGNEMKSFTYEIEDCIPWNHLLEKLTKEDQEKFDQTINSDDPEDKIEVNAEVINIEIDEMSGSRYKKTIFTCRLEVEVTVKWNGSSYNFSETLTSQAAASDYEELY